MPSRAARTDANHGAVVKAIRSVPGVSVRSTAALGDGFPDLAVGAVRRCRCGRGAPVTVLLEVKDGDKPPSRQRLTADERAFHDGWRGAVHTVTSADHAIQVVLSIIAGEAPLLTEIKQETKKKRKGAKNKCHQ